MSLLFADDFQRANTADHLGTSPSGHPWDYDALVRILDGKMVTAAGTGLVSAYPRVELSGRIARQTARFAFDGAAVSSGFTLISGRGSADLTPGGAPATMAHFLILPTVWGMTVYEDGVASDFLLGGLGNHVLATDGTEYEVTLYYDYQRSTCIAVLPAGGQAMIWDPRIAQTAGNIGAWQILINDAGDSHAHAYLSVAADVDPATVAGRSYYANLRARRGR